MERWTGSYQIVWSAESTETSVHRLWRGDEKEGKKGIRWRWHLADVNDKWELTRWRGEKGVPSTRNGRNKNTKLKKQLSFQALFIRLRDQPLYLWLLRCSIVTLHTVLKPRCYDPESSILSIKCCKSCRCALWPLVGSAVSCCGSGSAVMSGTIWSFSRVWAKSGCALHREK